MQANNLRKSIGKTVELHLVLPGGNTAALSGKLCYDEAEDDWSIEAERQNTKTPLGGSPDGRLIIQHTIVPQLRYRFEPEYVGCVAEFRESIVEAEQALGIKDKSRTLEDPGEEALVTTPGGGGRGLFEGGGLQ